MTEGAPSQAAALPLVSVIIPVKNGRENLRRLLHSLDHLDWPKTRLEIVVCDNGSHDGTQALARSRGCRVLDLPGLSIAGLRNQGAQQATGSLLAFVDSDCTVGTAWLTAAWPHLQQTGVKAAGCYPSPPDEATWVQALWTLKDRLKTQVQDAAWLPSMNLVVHRAAFEAIGGFDSSLSTCEDVDFCYRLRSAGGRIRWDPAIAVIHYGEPPTLQVLFRKERWHGMDNLAGLKRHGLRLEEVPSLALPLFTLGCFGLPLLTLPSSLLLGPWLPLLSSPLLLGPPLVAATAAARTAARARKPTAFPGLTAVYLTWLTARAVALLPVTR